MEKREEKGDGSERERCGFMSIAFTVLLLLCDGKEMDGVFGCWEGK